MDVLASDLSGNNFCKFWKDTNKLNIRTSIPLIVGGKHNLKDIGYIFKENFTVTSLLDFASDINSAIASGRSIQFLLRNLSTIVTTITKAMSPGHDGLIIEYFRYVAEHLPRILEMLFNFSLGHTYSPEAIVKNKTGDTSDISNYRPISLATIAAKILDSLLNGYLSKLVF